MPITEEEFRTLTMGSKVYIEGKEVAVNFLSADNLLVGYGENISVQIYSPRLSLTKPKVKKRVPLRYVAERVDYPTRHVMAAFSYETWNQIKDQIVEVEE